ncbi:hypothetical protein [Olsenella profusa]|uniref:Uncharacterized protein n=1 Tax=Olsenella profusa F0195 TaxID=1125712 RepID=U2TTA2_9ACTN|nr:hypothetical protein [Olsenella profusa]ERL09298.1 hypothetical protein HMPREF1316_1838 [Olsenella profusa F0195]
MTANLLGTISTVLLVLAVLLVIAAALMFFAFDIRAVRDELTGRTAERAIATMRAESWALRRSRERSARALTADGPDAPEGEGSGSLHLRKVRSQRSQDTSAGDEAGTTLLSDAGTGSDSDETGTTLLSADASDADETGTTLLANEGTGADEAGTTLLSADAPASADEAGTTLLSGDEAMTTLLSDQPSHEEGAQ